MSLPRVDGVRSRHVLVDGLRVHVAEAGSGPPLVLLHGWPQHWYCWHRVVPLLAPHFRLVMPDLRGHGWTDAPASGYDKEQLATDLLGLLDVLDLPQVGLVGHDWGGWAGFLACLRAPERFSAFLALGIPHPFQRARPAAALDAWRLAYQAPLSTPLLGRALVRWPGVVEQVIRAGSRADLGSDLRTYGEVLREPARARATVALYRSFLLHEGPRVMAGRYLSQRLTVPTRLVVGAHDPVASGRLLEGFEEHADDMSLEVLPGVGHFVPEEAPQVVADRSRALFA
ncbi:MAG: Soluble epoxide hydrolase [Frankiales bacterium]|nr:Soluble epoxide hydrolase [Frankiales bacterium]